MNAATASRAVQMLRIAANVIREHAPDCLYFYDSADCDGCCISDDCETAASEIEYDLAKEATP